MGCVALHEASYGDKYLSVLVFKLGIAFQSNPVFLNCTPPLHLSETVTLASLLLVCVCVWGGGGGGGCGTFLSVISI